MNLVRTVKSALTLGAILAFSTPTTFAQQTPAPTNMVFRFVIDGIGPEDQEQSTWSFQASPIPDVRAGKSFTHFLSDDLQPADLVGVTWSVRDMPSWGGFYPDWGVMVGEPSEADLGTVSFTVTATYEGVSKEATYTVTVLSNTFKVVQADVGNAHTCAVTPESTVKCWGYNADGRLGTGSTTASRYPVEVAGLSGVEQVALGEYHSCALTGDGSVWCWGNNAYGQLGNGTQTDSPLPTRVIGITNARQITAAQQHSCALLDDGTAKCWGTRTYGQLGDGVGGYEPVPEPVTVSLTGIKQISAGNFLTCAARDDGTPWCWGSGAGLNSATPVQVAGFGVVKDISTSGPVVCAVRQDGIVLCMGSNYKGGLGDGTTTDRPTPVEVIGITTGDKVQAGAYGSCASLVDGTVKCWGINTYGQAGDGSGIDQLTPVSVRNLTGVSQFATLGSHACAVAGGILHCWGYNAWGQLGNGKYQNQYTPVTTAVE
jgi:alpha-tubulin suppressor-like RCC1 family protein